MPLCLQASCWAVHPRAPALLVPRERWPPGLVVLAEGPSAQPAGLLAGLSDLPSTRRQSFEPRFLPLSLMSPQVLLCEATVTRLAQPII